MQNDFKANNLVNVKLRLILKFQETYNNILQYHNYVLVIKPLEIVTNNFDTLSKAKTKAP